MAADTGGTFTDAIAISPEGSWRRAKVPSDGRFGCRGHGQRGATTVRLNLPRWLPQSDRFLPHLRLDLGGAPIAILGTEAENPITDTDPARTPTRVRLAKPLPRDVDGTVSLVSPFDAPLLALHVLLGLAPGDSLPPLEFRIATTRATNALLERRGAATALLTTEGFGDFLAIGDQSRPDLFALAIAPRRPLAKHTMELTGRRCADGSERTPLDPDEIAVIAERFRREGIDAVAVALLHAHAAPEDERRVGALLRSAGIGTVGLASELSASPRILSRAETAVVHTSLTPILESTLAAIALVVPREATFMLTSAGGLQRSDRALARDALLSGPAGGLAGVAEVASRTGVAPLLGLDMGGTSADVGRWDGHFAYRFETRVGDARVAAPSLALETVAAGGGSVCSVHRGELRVGPESARAYPGPACYGLGGPLTLTDVNLLLGRLDADRAAVPLDVRAAEHSFAQVLRRVELERGEVIERQALLEGFIALADERMAAAIAAVSVREGVDPREHTLVPFGGAGGLHACSLADRLGIRQIILPVDAGLLSARGLLGASVERFAERAVLAPLHEVASQLPEWMAYLAAEARARVAEEAGERPLEAPVATVHLRLLGQDRPLAVPMGSEAALRLGFLEAFERLFGYPPPERAVEVESIRVVVRTREAAPVDSWHGTRTTPDRAGPIPVWDRTTLGPAVEMIGPALIADATSTAYLAPGWQARSDANGDIRIGRVVPAAARAASEGAADLDLFACRLEAIATAMGEQLQRTALSTNVKERLDYSCAVLDQNGTLVSNAPHLPVHLGAMGECTRAVAAALDLRPGDVAVTNHPAFGGSHLPDVTVITPVFEEDALLGYVASRAHHAEMGGTRPGSFPPSARSLAEEGVVLPPLRVVEAGRSRLERVEALLREAPYPSRSIAENLADLEAAIAANAHGARGLRQLADRYGRTGLADRCAKLLDRGASVMEATLASLGEGTREACERLDDGAPIAVRITINAGRARIDFTGSASVHERNLNAPRAVVRSAVLYCLRLVIGESIPLNEGILRPIELVIPEGMLHPRFDPDPARCPPVVAGNTETSQRVTDALLKAFGVVAGGQGTMNNLLFGNERYGMYETIAGGAGATSDADGASAVHVHMTNTRITDPEVLERRCPVLVRQFRIRRDSGGAGRHRGGDGVVREIEFLEPVQLSLLAQHRVERPYAIDGAEPGAPGRQWIVRRSGTREAIDGVAQVDLEAGEAILIETPGGGGWGRVHDEVDGGAAAQS